MVWSQDYLHIGLLHAQYSEQIPHAYLGYLQPGNQVTQFWLYEAFREMNLLTSGGFRDGQPF